MTHPTSHPVYSYANDVEKQNNQLMYKIAMLERDIVELEKQVTLPARRIEKIEVTQDAYVAKPVNHWFTAADLTSQTTPYINTEQAYKVKIELILDAEQLKELQQKLNNNNWSNYK